MRFFIIKGYFMPLPLIIGVAGSSGSGKTTITAQIAAHYQQECIIISVDDYYLGKKRMPNDSFDEPAAIDFEKLRKDLVNLRNNKPILKPRYDFTCSEPMDDVEVINPHPVIIVEGVLACALESILELFDVKVFVDTDLDVCRDRRIKRDVEERGRTKESALEQWRNVEECYNKYVLPSKDQADIRIINNEGYKESELHFDVTDIIKDIDNRRHQNRPNEFTFRKTHFTLYPTAVVSSESDSPMSFHQPVVSAQC